MFLIGKVKSDKYVKDFIFALEEKWKMTKKKRVVLTEKASRVKFWKGTVKQAKQIHFCMFASWLFTGSSLCWLYRLEMVLIFQLILTNIEPVNRFRHLPKDFGLLPVLEHIYSIISFALLHAEPHPKVCTGWLDCEGAHKGSCVFPEKELTGA